MTALKEEGQRRIAVKSLEFVMTRDDADDAPPAVFLLHPCSQLPRPTPFWHKWRPLRREIQRIRRANLNGYLLSTE